MIPTDPKILEELEKLADRNIANGDWGDEVTIYGLPGEDHPRLEAERLIDTVKNHPLPFKK